MKHVSGIKWVHEASNSRNGYQETECVSVCEMFQGLKGGISDKCQIKRRDGKKFRWEERTETGIQRKRERAKVEAGSLGRRKSGKRTKGHWYPDTSRPSSRTPDPYSLHPCLQITGNRAGSAMNQYSGWITSAVCFLLLWHGLIFIGSSSLTSSNGMCEHPGQKV